MGTPSSPLPVRAACHHEGSSSEEPRISPFSVMEAIPVVGPLLAALGTVGLLLAVGLALLALVPVRRTLSRPGSRPDQMVAVTRQEVMWRPKRVLNGGEATVYASACSVVTGIDTAGGCGRR